MKKVIEWIKNKKIILVGIIVVILIAIGIVFYIDFQMKKYTLEEVSEINYYLLSKNNLFGVIDKQGNTIIEPIYNNIKIPNPEKAVFICEVNGVKKAFNDKSQQIFSQYDAIEEINLKGIVSSIPYEKTVLKYKKDEKYGLIDYNGKIITRPIYDSIEGLEHKEGEILVKKENKYGVINSKGATIVKIEYDSVVADGYYDSTGKYAFSGYIIGKKTEQGYRYGYISYKLQKILEPEYNAVERILSINDSKKAYLIVTKNGQKGIVKDGEIIINYAYQDIIYDDYNEQFILTRGENKGTSNITGNIVIPISYKEINVNGLYLEAIDKEDKIFYFDANGNEITDVTYESILTTDNPNYYITINSEGNYGLVNQNKENLLKETYRYLEYLYDDYFIASKQNGYLGIINSNDEILVDFNYGVLQKLDNTKVIEAKILNENLTDLYSSTLEKIYSKQGTSISVVDNYVQAYSQEETKYFDVNGDEMENTKIFNGPLYASKKQDKWGFVDIEGNVKVDYLYDRATEFNEFGFAGIKLDGKWGVIDKDGNVVVEPTYEIEDTSIIPEFIGTFYKVYYGYGENYYTDEV